jgi:hypothetical protein
VLGVVKARKSGITDFQRDPTRCLDAPLGFEAKCERSCSNQYVQLELTVLELQPDARVVLCVIVG